MELQEVLICEVFGKTKRAKTKQFALLHPATVSCHTLRHLYKRSVFYLILHSRRWARPEENWTHFAEFRCYAAPPPSLAPCIGFVYSELIHRVALDTNIHTTMIPACSPHSPPAVTAGDRGSFCGETRAQFVCLGSCQVFPPPAGRIPHIAHDQGVFGVLKKQQPTNH